MVFTDLEFTSLSVAIAKSVCADTMAHCCATVALLVVISVLARATADKKPHIVFMMVDDWGWANAGYHRDTPTKDIQTPNIDSLVKQGLQLDQHYVFTGVPRLGQHSSVEGCQYTSMMSPQVRLLITPKTQCRDLMAFLAT